MLTEVYPPQQNEQPDPLGPTRLNPGDDRERRESNIPIENRLFEPDLRVCVNPSYTRSPPYNERFHKNKAKDGAQIFAIEDDRGEIFERDCSLAELDNGAIVAVGFGIELDPWIALRIRAKYKTSKSADITEYDIPLLSSPSAENDSSQISNVFAHDSRPIHEIRYSLRTLASARYDLTRMRHVKELSKELLKNKPVRFDAALYEPGRDTLRAWPRRNGKLNSSPYLRARKPDTDSLREG